MILAWNVIALKSKKMAKGVGVLLLLLREGLMLIVVVTMALIRKVMLLIGTVTKLSQQ